MKRKSSFTLVLVVLILSSPAVLAGPIDPAEKLFNAPAETSAPVITEWHLQNGAFDEAWNGDVPQSWQVYPGDADAYGSLEFLIAGASEDIVDNAFVFQIDNDEVKGNQNAYLYQKTTLTQGDYWLSANSTIYGTGNGARAWDGESGPGAYDYMAYYALVLQADALVEGEFTPSLINATDWKELWPWSNVCNEEVKGWGVGEKTRDCDYVKRAETVSVAGGEYVFVLRAELKWPDWRAFAIYIFDDIQIISATPLAENFSACVTSYCLEGLIDR